MNIIRSPLVNPIKVKEVGKVFSTNDGINNKCECGKKVEIYDFLWWRLNKNVDEINPEEQIRLGFCKCGNIFIRQYLRKSKKSIEKMKKDSEKAIERTKRFLHKS